MSSDSKALKTFNVKKDKRLQAKKRKLEAFLNLVKKDEEIPRPPKKKSNESFGDSYKALKDELNKYRSRDILEPAFHIGDAGKRALVQVSGDEKKVGSSSPIFFEDVYHLLLRSILGHSAPAAVSWVKLERPQYIEKTIVIEIEGLNKGNMLHINSELNKKGNFFQYIFEMMSSKTPFATELSTLHLTSDFNKEAKDNFSALFPLDGESKEKSVKPSKKSKRAVSKLHLLLSPIQLAMENFPMPQSVFEKSNCVDYVFTKDSYSPVTSDSPMFAMDCEMCITTSGKNEVTRIAIVDEKLETVYHTLVKPKEKITNYMTRFSGVTESMLENVKTTLKDVHEAIREMLPSDAILCGQSLNNDLHSLKMIHPYVIDTSVIFNQSGIRNKKPSLKNLSRMHLKEIIQDNKRGHNPIEDSIATMKLVHLKLKKNVQYGDAVLTPEETVDSEKSAENANEVIDSSETSKFSGYVQLNEGPEHCGFFERIAKFAKKKVCLIGTEEALSNYCLESTYDNIAKITKSKNKKVIKATLKNTNEFNLVISHLTLNAENSSVTEVIDSLYKMYDSIPNKTFFLVLAVNNNKNDDKNFNHNQCMTVLKNLRTF